jgi:hypothetical protein
MNQDENTREWSRDQQKMAVLTWISFLVAVTFTMFFFAFVDPLIIIESLNVEIIESRNAGYTIGFLFLWALGWISGWLVLRLVRRKRQGPRSIRPSDDQ